MRWSEVQYRETGGNESLCKRFIGVVSDEKWRAGVESVSELMIEKKKQLQETAHSTLLFGCFYLLYMLYSNLSHDFCW
jgi:hypothetical protein